MSGQTVLNLVPHPLKIEAEARRIAARRLQRQNDALIRNRRQLVPARMEDERRGNMGSLVGGRARSKLAPREGQVGPARWRMGL